jgi:hypothetical protein
VHGESSRRPSFQPKGVFLVEAERVVQGSLQKSLFGEASVAVSL